MFFVGFQHVQNNTWIWLFSSEFSASVGELYLIAALKLKPVCTYSILDILLWHTEWILSGKSPNWNMITRFPQL